MSPFYITHRTQKRFSRVRHFSVITKTGAELIHKIGEYFPYKAHLPNIHALNSDTHTLRIQYEYAQKQYVGVAIEGVDIWYMAHIIWAL